jgi:hypothetical protein
MPIIKTVRPIVHRMLVGEISKIGPDTIIISILVTFYPLMPRFMQRAARRQRSLAGAAPSSAEATTGPSTATGGPYAGVRTISAVGCC